MNATITAIRNLALARIAAAKSQVADLDKLTHKADAELINAQAAFSEILALIEKLQSNSDLKTFSDVLKMAEADDDSDDDEFYGIGGAAGQHAAFSTAQFLTN